MERDAPDSIIACAGGGFRARGPIPCCEYLFDNNFGKLATSSSGFVLLLLVILILLTSLPPRPNLDYSRVALRSAQLIYRKELKAILPKTRCFEA